MMLTIGLSRSSDKNSEIISDFRKGFFMGYNVKDYIRIRDEFAKKYQIARNVSESRREEVHAAVPEIARIDVKLSHTGLDIMDVIRKGGNTETAIAELERRNNALMDERRKLLVANGYPSDYTDVHYDCDKCADTGFVDTVMCSCMKKALVKAGFESSGLGALIGTQRFDNFKYGYYGEDVQARMKSSVTMLRDFAENFGTDTYENFLMIGTTGLGKTHLSTAVAEKIIERGFSVRYVSAVSMMRDFSNSIRRSADDDTFDMSVYYDCDLLIIDDLGTEVANRLTQSYFYEIINERINKRKCTIINTNLKAGDLSEMYTERVASRILGEYTALYFSGVDIRKQKSLT